MIWICTLNPSLDYHMHVDDFELGKTNRSQSEHIVVGGKGINVAVVLNELCIPSAVFGFVGGFTGDRVRSELQKYPWISDYLISVQGDTRINVKIKGKTETEINGMGQSIPLDALLQIEQTVQLISDEDVVVITGSVAKGMRYQWYLEFVRLLSQRKIPFIVDIADEILLEIIKYKPLLIKPNVSELEGILNQKLDSETAIINAGKMCVMQGAQACLISRGADGSALVTEAGVWTSNVPDGTLINSVGAGDSMVAGFIKGWMRSLPLEMVYQYAVACATATTYSVHLADKETINNLLSSVKIIKADF